MPQIPLRIPENPILAHSYPVETGFEKILVYKFGRLIMSVYFYGLVFVIDKPTRELKPENLSYGKQSLDGAVFLYGPFFISFLLHRQGKENIVRQFSSSRDSAPLKMSGFRSEDIFH